MFEQATLSNGPQGKRVWSTFIGMTGEAVLVGFAILAPMIWPEVLPKLQSAVWILPPVPPPAPPAGDVMVRPRTQNVSHPQFQLQDSVLRAPSHIPQKPMMIEDPPDIGPSFGVPGGVPNGSRDGVPGGLTDIIRAGNPPTAAPPRPPDPAPAPVAKDTTPIRVRQGGLVHPATVIHRVEPIYPQLAKISRIAGIVELEGVIGTDGRIRELKVKSGHPFLVKAALDAVRQWVYTPTTLNGDPVEVIAPITVTFRLN
jgi:protein TonB